MNIDFTSEELSNLSNEQTAALLGALLLALMEKPEIDDATIQRLREFVSTLPWVPDPILLEQTLAAATTRYASGEPSQSTSFISEIAAQLTDPVLREKTVVAMQRIEGRNMDEQHPGVIGDAITAFGITPERLAQLQQASAAPPPAEPTV